MTLQMRLIFGLAFMIGLSLATANVQADDPARDVSYGYTEQELVFVSALNEYRAARGLRSVGLSDELSRACREWSSRMRQRGQLSHDPTGGMEICAQITHESGIRALEVWQRSPAHNAILLSSRIETIGIGSDGIWWTMRGSSRDVGHAVFRTTDVRTEVTAVIDDTMRRVPMGVSISSVQRSVTPIIPTTEERTEIEADTTGRRVPMSVLESGIPRGVSTTTPFRYRVR